MASQCPTDQTRRSACAVLSGRSSRTTGSPRTPHVPAGRGRVTRRARGGGRRGAAWPGVRLAGGAGAEVREDLVDHRRLGSERDEAHRAVAGGARERVDVKDLLQERRRRAFAHRRLASAGPSRGAGTMSGGTASALPRMPERETARAVGVPAVVPRRHAPLVGDVHQDPGEELSREFPEVPAIAVRSD